MISKFIFRFSSTKCARLGQHLVQPLQPSTKNNLLWLHGIFDSSTNFIPLAENESLRKITSSHLLDARNHGSSEKIPSMTYKEMALDLVSYIANSDLNDIYIIGHSMGGRTAMTAMRDYNSFLQKRIKGIIIVDALPNYRPLLGSNQQKNSLDSLDHLKNPLNEGSPIEEVFRFFNELKSINLIGKTLEQVEQEVKQCFKIESIAQSVLSNIKQRKDGTLKWKINFEGFENSSEDLLNFQLNNQLWDSPRKIFIGAKSKFINVESAAEQYPNIFFDFNAEKDIVIFEKSGHFPHIKQPEKFVKEVVKFIEETDVDPKTIQKQKQKENYLDESLSLV